MATKTRTPTDAAVDAMIENADLAPEVKALLRVHHEEVIAGERRLLQRTFDAGARSAEKSAEEVFGEIHEMVAAAFDEDGGPHGREALGEETRRV